MRAVLLLSLLQGVVWAQSFTPDTGGFESAVGVVMTLVVTLATVAIVVGIMWFLIAVWIHRGA